MLLLDEKSRDEIVKFCESAVCPAPVGFSLIQIATVLKGLPAQEIAEKPIEP